MRVRRPAHATCKNNHIRLTMLDGQRADDRKISLMIHIFFLLGACKHPVVSLCIRIGH